MCGRFVLTADGTVIQQVFNLDILSANMSARYNIAPSQSLAVVTNQSPKTLTQLEWGLIPSWAKDPSIANNLINARSETAHEKPSFKAALRDRRCLIPTNGWYEWRVDASKQKTPFFVHQPDYALFAYAGLWESWRSPAGEQRLTCTILTTDATPELREIHHRMPIVVHRGDYERWLYDDGETVLPMVSEKVGQHTFQMYPVSSRVNKPLNDSPENIIPVEDPGTMTQLSLF